MTLRYSILSLLVLVLVTTSISCRTARRARVADEFPTLAQEPQWIRNGLPIEFNKKSWFPSDGIESLLDSEVYLLGEYQSVQFFADKTDVRPFERIYTKFDKNKFRYYTPERRR